MGTIRHGSRGWSPVVPTLLRALGLVPFFCWSWPCPCCYPRAAATLCPPRAGHRSAWGCHGRGRSNPAAKRRNLLRKAGVGKESGGTPAPQPWAAQEEAGSELGCDRVLGAPTPPGKPQPELLGSLAINEGKTISCEPSPVSPLRGRGGGGFVCLLSSSGFGGELHPPPTPRTAPTSHPSPAAHTRLVAAAGSCGGRVLSSSTGRGEAFIVVIIISSSKCGRKNAVPALPVRKNTLGGSERLGTTTPGALRAARHGAAPGSAEPGRDGAELGRDGLRSAPPPCR